MLFVLKYYFNYPRAQISAIDGGTPLHFAAARGKMACIQFLIDEVGVSTAILHEVHCFLQLNIDVNERDNNGTVPLYFAAQEGHTDVAKLLLQHGGDPLAKVPPSLIDLLNSTNSELEGS